MEVTDADVSAIRERAYFRWLDAGSPCCDGVEYWLAAEDEYFHMLDADRTGAGPDSTSAARTAQGRKPGSDRAAASGERASAQLRSQPDKEVLIGSRG